MVAMLIGTISLNVLLVVARPFNRLKVGLLGGLSIALFLVFFVFSSIFSLVNLWQWQLALIYLPLMISTVPFYLLIQEFLGRRVLSKINWR